MIPALKEQRAAKVDALKAILTKAENEKRDLSDGEQSAFDSGRTEIEKLERDIRNAEFLAEAERRAHGEPVNGGGARPSCANSVCARRSRRRSPASTSTPVARWKFPASSNAAVVAPRKACSARTLCSKSVS
jgi:HK97 family phage major capsid protein